MQKYKWPIVLTLLLAWFGVVVWLTVPRVRGGPQPLPKFETKRGAMGAVSVEVTPTSLGGFEVVLNTHSVDLDFDLTKAMSLSDDLGNVYSPISWSGGKGGHHLTGSVVFGDILKKARKVTLTISEIENSTFNEIESPTLSFSWDLAAK